MPLLQQLLLCAVAEGPSADDIMVVGVLAMFDNVEPRWLLDVKAAPAAAVDSTSDGEDCRDIVKGPVGNMQNWSSFR